MMTIRIYNTMTRQKEVFEPIEDGKVKIYSCGPTVYDYFHLGNARAFIVPDLIRRYLEFRGYEVTWVQNLTDVDDKIIKRATDEGISFEEVVSCYSKAFFEDIKKLGIKQATVYPRATEHISNIIDLIETLVSKGFAYVVGGDVFFDVSKFPSYGKLSNQDIGQLSAGARVDVDERKRNPIDFALWKSAKPGEPRWQSPWSQGRPGWHIECSAMSMTYLGETFDIHTGGQDLIFPHHENEIAQSEAATGKPFVKYWIHNGYINIDGEKMSKSLGNFFALRQIVEEYPPNVVRLFLVSSHYRSPINFSDEELNKAERSLDRLKNSVRAINEILVKGDEVGKVDEDKLDGIDSNFNHKIVEARERFINGMDDDFNTAIAISVLHDLAKEVNIFINSPEFQINPIKLSLLRNAMEAFEDFGEVLGISLIEGDSTKLEGKEEELVELLLRLRDDARKKKDWSMADAIRNGLKEIGIIVEDTPQGARWKQLNGKER